MHLPTYFRADSAAIASSFPCRMYTRIDRIIFSWRFIDIGTFLRFHEQAFKLIAVAIPCGCTWCILNWIQTDIDKLFFALLHCTLHTSDWLILMESKVDYLRSFSIDIQYSESHFDRIPCIKIDPNECISPFRQHFSRTTNSHRFQRKRKEELKWRRDDLICRCTSMTQHIFNRLIA